MGTTVPNTSKPNRVLRASQPNSDMLIIVVIRNGVRVEREVERDLLLSCSSLLIIFFFLLNGGQVYFHNFFIFFTTPKCEGSERVTAVLPAPPELPTPPPPGPPPPMPIVEACLGVTESSS
ncbi:hypothetical protein T492DRAFT_839383 [Pavlovales sp. CCMP2436]|nr:hypothetical protein T492DRAFT_839383 [Pavlovales sp. CCMP2436]